MSPDISPIKPIRVWKGEEPDVPVVAARPLAIAVRESEADSIAYSVIVPYPPVAPVRKGQKIGELIFSCGEEEIGRYDLLAERDVEPSGFFKRVWDTVMMGVGSLLGVTG
jgi:D-alanyl-D-alanine carboxypeptidase (penicillin-binding protein 5/6)